MRKLTKTTFTLVSFGAMGVSYAIGANAQVPQSYGASSTVTAGDLTPSTGTKLGSSSSVNSSTATSASASASSTAASSSGTGGSSNAGASSSGNLPQPSKSASPAPAASSSASSTAVQPSANPTKTTTSSSTKTGSAISYRYGTIQLSVVKNDGAITAINLVQAGATGGREQAFPYLVKAAIAAQGVSIANLSGATFTTQAFEQALTSALGKF